MMFSDVEACVRYCELWKKLPQDQQKIDAFAKRYRYEYPFKCEGDPAYIISKWIELFKKTGDNGYRGHGIPNRRTDNVEHDD